MAPRAGHRGLDQLVQAQRLVRLVRRLAVARELDEVADQLAQLLELEHEVAAQALAVGRRQRAPRPEDLEVGAQRRERRAQLVRGVGHEPALRPLGLVQRAEHRVEGGGEARQLVAASGLDPAREVARACDVLGRLGQLGHRPHGVARRQTAEEGGEQDARDRDEAEAEPQIGERAVDLGERARHLEGQAGRGAAGEHPHVDAVDVLVGEELAAAAVGDGAHLVGVAQAALRLAAHRHQAIAFDELREHDGPLERLGAGQHAGGDPRRRRGRRRLAQRAVDLAAQRVADDEVRDHRAERHGDGDRGRSRERDAAPEAHDSRST